MLNFAKVSAASDGALIRAYLTEDKPEPETLKVHGVAIDGRDLETGERLRAYYTGRGERATWRPDMAPEVAAALGVASIRAEPRDDELDALFEARRADNGADWSEHIRKNSGFDFVFAPHKSVSLAAEFAPTEAERQIIRNAIHSASDDALRYAAQDLGVARKGHAGEKGAERGEIGWVTFAHKAARPTLAVQNGPDGATYLMDAPIAGDPHYHLHNFIPNLVVTDQGRIGSIDSRALTAHKVHEYGAIFQARLADRLRALGVRVGLDAEGEAIRALDIPERAVTTFSKRDRQVIGDAKRYAQENAIDWDELSLERKKQLLHEASAAGRLGKRKDEARSVWREQAATIGWTAKSVLAAAAAPIARTDAERYEAAYARTSESLSAEFQTAAVLDAERLRVHAARGLIEAGAAGGRDDVDAVVALLEQRGFVHDGKSASLIFGFHEGKARFSHSEQLRIERGVAEKAFEAAADRSAALTDTAIRAAIHAVEAGDAGIRFTREQRAAIHALGRGGKLSLMTGVAGSGKTTLLKPLIEAWKAEGRTIAGMSTAWTFGAEPQVLVTLEHAIRGGRPGRHGQPSVVSRKMQFVMIDEAGRTRDAGPAPYLDFRPLRSDEREAAERTLAAAWLKSDIERQAMHFAIAELAPTHLRETRERRLAEIDRVEREVKSRLKPEIATPDSPIFTNPSRRPASPA